MSVKSGLAAVVIPGVLTGFIIWGVEYAGENYLVPMGLVPARADAFTLTLFIVIPVIMVICGGISERIRSRGERTGWEAVIPVPGIPFLAGLLGVMSAFVLFVIGTSVKIGTNLYPPILDPGLIPRLGYAVYMVTGAMPFVLFIGSFYALFSLAGSSIIQRLEEEIRIPKEIREQEDRRKNG
jgi:hypothetical protein